MRTRPHTHHTTRTRYTHTVHTQHTHTMNTTHTSHTYTIHNTHNTHTLHDAHAMHTKHTPRGTLMCLYSHMDFSEYPLRKDFALRDPRGRASRVALSLFLTGDSSLLPKQSTHEPYGSWKPTPRPQTLCSLESSTLHLSRDQMLGRIPMDTSRKDTFRERAALTCAT